MPADRFSGFTPLSGRPHAGDREALGRETMALYRAGGVSPLAGCLPALAQAPFLFLMYRLFTTADGDASLLGDTFFGAPLGWHVLDGPAGAAQLLVLLVLLGVLAWRSSRRIRATMVTDVGPLDRVLPLLPYATLVVAALVPLAATLYLVTTTAWTALEHAVLRRPSSIPPTDVDTVTRSS
jgi:YidC/Oxa1 family membrane protein insertase